MPQKITPATNLLWRALPDGRIVGVPNNGCIGAFDLAQNAAFAAHARNNHAILCSTLRALLDPQANAATYARAHTVLEALGELATA